VNPSVLTTAIKSKAVELGFMSCGIAQAKRLDEQANYLSQWLSKGQHGTMAYMANYFDLRTDPRLLLPGAQSVIVVLKNYFPGPKLTSITVAPGIKIAKYALGIDYHYVIKAQLALLLSYIEELNGPCSAKICVDSAPFMDKVWAQRAGLGWIGKHTNVIRKGVGSFFLIGSIIIDIVLDYDNPTADYCGTCTRCIDACPTAALTSYEIDATKCISYFTIENKQTTSTEFVSSLNGWAFGCDICQDVCPWNRFMSPHDEPLFEGLPFWAWNHEQWEKLSGKQYQKTVQRSPLSRIRLQKWLQNITQAQESLMKT
jgi:epoxyqueuosine reductase